ncbi:MAG: ribonuclease D [Isosphaeraceae bacterium]
MADATGAATIINTAQLDRLVAHLRTCGRFAFDTEFVSEDTFEPVLCLIQVATRAETVVIDPLQVHDLSAFWDVVTDPSVQVVMHAAGEDLRICLLRAGKLPLGVFDVQLAAGFIGYSYPLSLVNLVGQALGISLAGSETRTDWRRRPLSAAQIQYALDDVRHLLDLADHISGRLEALGRAGWAEAEFRDMVKTIAGRAEEDRWRRLPNLNQLSRRGLEAARQLAAWREDEARSQNRPLRHVMRDDLVVGIAKRLPRNRRDLEALRDFNRPALLSQSNTILAILDRARSAPDETLPEHFSRPEEPPGVAMVGSLLSAALAQCCAQNQVAAPLVANATDLRHLVRWHLEGRDEARRPLLLQGWRHTFCGQLLLDILDGRLALRVAEPGGEFPVVLDPVK